MKLSDAFGVDKELEVNGVWVPLKSMRFLIARLGNPKFKALYRKALEAKQAFSRFAGADEAHDQEIFLECMSKAVLLDWDGVDGEDGKPLPYSPEVGLRAMKDDQLFADFVSEASQKLDLYKAQHRETTEKNSCKP